jgi:hypothetical protein
MVETLQSRFQKTERKAVCASEGGYLVPLRDSTGVEAETLALVKYTLHWFLGAHATI